MADPQLIEPAARYKDSYAAALREGLHLEPAPEEEILLAEKDFDAYMAHRHDLSRPVTLPNGLLMSRLPQIDLWLVKDGEFLGIASIRPQLNEPLRERGGNLGYAVRKSERGKGYGKLMMQLALPHAKALGLDKLLITCNDDNTGSIKIIEGAGGVLQDKISIEGLPVLHRRYWIQLKA